ncbi:MAG TPA: glycoside hydrolase family 172 protein [Gaiellaceae bacterium]|nr:glycoside hydrolase family 172 protein [Gaiellaceae bacterium]
MDAFATSQLQALSLLVDARTRSLSAENPDGAKGGGGRATEGTGAEAARELGQGWKVNPFVEIPACSTITLADLEGPGVVQHIWLTLFPSFWRRAVLRAYWDREEEPSIEVPVGDFFCNGWGVHCDVASIPVAVNPSGGFNSYWAMPFRERARITVENLVDEPLPALFYQLTWSQQDVPDDAAYLHCQWRRSNPVADREPHTLLDGVAGRGHYVGTYLAWGSNSSGWWGEGELKFFLDGDRDWPTICGTGTEDYFGGAWGFGKPGGGGYAAFTTPYLGMPQVLLPDAHERSQLRFGMYRWHVPDPIRFDEDLRVTVQALGWRSPIGGRPRYLPLRDDVASTAFWYQTEPHAPFPALPDANALEVV